MKYRKYIFPFTIILMIISCSGVSRQVNRIDIAGSDTMYYLTIRLASEYMKLHPEVTIYVKGGGSSTGFDALQNGNADICMSSRNIRSDEVKTLAEKYSAVGMSYLIAKDALSIYVSWFNKVESLTVKQIRDIFRCRVNNWESVGGDNDSIVVVNRTPQSGTYDYFRSHILEDEDFCDNAIISNSTDNVIANIIKNKNAIGYGGIAFHEGVKHIKIYDIEPSEKNVRNDTYPIIRYLYFYTIKSPRGEVKKFIDWVMSNEAQKVIDNFGFISIWE